MSSLTPKRYSPGRRVSFSEPLTMGPTGQSKGIDLITTQKVIAWVERKAPSEEDVKKQLADRDEREKKLVAEQPVCPNIGPDQVNKQNLKELLDKGFYDPEIMTQAFCAINGVVLSAEQAGATRRIRRFLGRMGRIGSESAYGIAMSADLKTVVGPLEMSEKGVIVKTLKDLKDDNSLLHEYVVGVFGLNRLRSWIPNFSFILGALKCSDPILRGDTVLTYCEASPNVTYVIYERIPGSDMRKTIPRLGRTDYISYFYQVALALRLAHLQCDFTHFDLHAENVIMRSVNSPVAEERAKLDPNFNSDMFYIPYPRSGGEILIHTTLIPTLIDYGTSHIRFGNQTFGNPKLVQYGVLSNSSFPMHDIYKFNMSCALAAQEASNKEVLEICEIIFRFFNKSENFLEALNVQWNSRTFLMVPPEVGLVAVRHDEFLRYFEDNFASEIAKFTMPATGMPTNGLVLSCGGNNICSSPQDIERSLKATTPNTLLDAWENNQPISPTVFGELEIENRQEFLLAVSKTGEASRYLQPNWLSLSTNVSQEYYQQLLNMVDLLDNAWQTRRYATAALGEAKEVYKDNPTSDDVSSFYNNEYSNFSNIFAVFIRSVLDNFSSDVQWLRSNVPKLSSSEDGNLILRNIGAIVDFANSFSSANFPSRPRI